MPIRFEVRPDDDEKFQAINDMIKSLLNGCSEAEFLQFRCPFCGNALKMDVHPGLHTFYISCARDSMHFFKTQRVENPPQWWRTKTSNGWLD